MLFVGEPLVKLILTKLPTDGLANLLEAEFHYQSTMFHS